MKCVCFKVLSFASLFAVLSTVGALLQGCGASGDKPTFEFMPHMAESPSLKAQEAAPKDYGMMTPVEGTIPVGYQPYAYPNDPELAGKKLKNPLPRSKDILLRGQKLFNTYCIVCHGVRGEGNGNVVPKFPQPPSLNSEKVQTWTDGRIFHVITMGQNLMPNYASQMDPDERWAVIHYVRVLQRSLNPTPQDIKELKDASK